MPYWYDEEDEFLVEEANRLLDALKRDPHFMKLALGYASLLLLDKTPIPNPENSAEGRVDRLAYRIGLRIVEELVGAGMELLKHPLPDGGETLASVFWKKSGTGVAIGPPPV